MKIDLGDLNAFVAVARANGFRDGARASGGSASGLSEAVRRLEAQLGVRLLNRTTRSVVPTEAGTHLLQRLGRLYVGPEFQFPLGPDPAPGYVLRTRIKRVTGHGPWAGQ